MTSKITGFEIPTRYANFCICGLAFVMLMVANLLPASAAAIGVQPGILKALGEPAAAIDSTPSPDLLLVRRGGGGRKAYRGGGGGRKAYRRGGGGRRAYRGGGGSRKAYRRGGGHRKAYRSRGYKRRYSRGPSIYFSIPYYAYPRYYSYRPYYGRCEYWRRRCAANWGYRNSDYYGCMRYHGCR